MKERSQLIWKRLLKIDLGLISSLWSLLNSEHDVDAWLRTDLTGIIVDQNCFMEDRFQNRTRFSFAHEVGHLFLHKETYAKLSINSPEEWQFFVRNLSEAEYSRFEWQANEFAGRLLVPRDILAAEIEKVRDRIVREGLGSFLEANPEAVMSGVTPALSRPFGVSAEVIETRLDRETGLWPPKLS